MNDSFSCAGVTGRVWGGFIPISGVRGIVDWLQKRRKVVGPTGRIRLLNDDLLVEVPFNVPGHDLADGHILRSLLQKIVAGLDHGQALRHEAVVAAIILHDVSILDIVPRPLYLEYDESECDILPLVTALRFFEDEDDALIEVKKMINYGADVNE